MSAPTANAGSNQTVTDGSVLLLTGIYAAGTSPLKGVKWTQVSGPDCTMTYPSKGITPVYELSAGTYVFQLSVSDHANAVTTSQTTITVSHTTGPVFPPKEPYPYNFN